MESTLESNLSDSRQASRTVRIAASLFFFLCLPMSLWETNYVQARIFVPQDPVATANNLLANEFIFRGSIFSHLFATMFFVMMVLMFYRLLRPVDKNLSLLMVIPMLAQIPIVFVLEALNYTALMTLKGDPRPTFDVAQQQEVAYFLIRTYRYGIGADKLPFGLCFIPFGMLLIKSGLAPRIIGILMIIGGAGYIADTSLYLLMQRPLFAMVRPFMMPIYTGWMLALLWFLVKGVRTKPA